MDGDTDAGRTPSSAWTRHGRTSDRVRRRGDRYTSRAIEDAIEDAKGGDGARGTTQEGARRGRG